ncbi:MAG TPA: RNA polymerase factor sigma-54 [Burkholderiaceae bacterium]|nr:RNA polymerase factor sigma-54 [Burkholderiaceae bacterium]
MNHPALRLEHRQHQTLTPRLQQAVRLLQLSSLDFAQEVQQALDSNPFLEEDGDTTIPAVKNSEDMAPVDSASSWETTPDVPADSTQASEPSWEREGWTATVGTGGRQGGADGELDLVEMMAADVSLRDHLHSQINVMPLSERDHMLTALIIESLDDDGYLRVSLDEVLQMSELQPPADIDEMTVALKLVQSLDPSGVAARDVRECLLLQLRSIEDEAERDLAQKIVTGHLDRLAMRDIPHLARALDRTPAKIEAVCERIRHLDPRPGWRFGAANVQYVTPDVIVRKGKNNQWITMLNPDVVPKVRLNQMYAELFQQHRESGHAELAAHLREARWTVRNVEQRFSTILDVAEAIVRRQCHFFEYGPLAMKPLGLREIAEELGLHESTVCRVTNNKYMATPSGVFELKYFFSRALPTPSGGAASATAIRGMIRDMIEAENAADPLSDAQIARQLARQGLSVARRTVTKYRQMMKLPAVEKRRRHS